MALLIIFIILLPNIINGRHPGCRNHHSFSDGGHTQGLLGRKTENVAFKQKEKIGRQGVGRRAPITLHVVGSSLPDCSHACGSCSPCRLVMVSFICKEEAETCPMAYNRPSPTIFVACLCDFKSVRLFLHDKRPKHRITIAPA
ncbi:Protein EPIDERMAL PATTERNING FACTOR 1 [Platanthera guangdongensis]|uniref:Epidermal patterning factor-like protein n=1 Tax=Platanthera guangdongensis TaxID=2320717 RepID=A0ABR2MLY5_9ASPA